VVKIKERNGVKKGAKSDISYYACAGQLRKRAFTLLERRYKSFSSAGVEPETSGIVSQHAKFGPKRRLKSNEQSISLQASLMWNNRGKTSHNITFGMWNNRGRISHNISATNREKSFNSSMGYWGTKVLCASKFNTKGTNPSLFRWRVID